MQLEPRPGAMPPGMTGAERTPNPADDPCGGQPRMAALANLRLIVRTAQRHSARIEKTCGVSGAQLWVMQELRDAPGLRIGAIAARLGIHQTTASNLVDALARRGLIDKLRDPDDMRAVKVVLSRAGLALLHRAPEPTRGLLPDALCRLSSAELAELNRGLASLVRVIDGVDEDCRLQPLPFTM
jgi:DNA-binding MarR family transcriptional regulator